MISLACISAVFFATCLHGVCAVGTEPEEVGAKFANLREIRFPECDSVISVTLAPYFAKGDGLTDDTEAIQRALSDMMGRHQVLYFPPGVYLVSKTLVWSKKNSAGAEAWGHNYLQGASAQRTTIRLKDATFTDPAKPQAIMWCGGFGSADWFHNYVEDLTFDVGANNPGAIGLQFYSNNSGAVRNCRFIANKGSGSVGLDLAHRDMNGPLLVKNCEVAGFRRGIVAGRAVNGQTFESLTLKGQAEVGFSNEGQALSIRGLLSEDSVAALHTYGVLCLVDAQFTGRQGAETSPAVVNYNGGRIYLRDVKTSGYQRAVGDVETPDHLAAYRIRGVDKPGSEGPEIKEYWSHPATTPFPSVAGSLRLAVKNPPVLPFDEASKWANVDRFGADPTGQRDSSAAIQEAIDSGASTIFFPGQHYALKSTVHIRGKARRLVGVGGMLDYAGQAKPDFRIIDGEPGMVSLEHFSHIQGGVEIDSNRTVYFRSVADCDLTMSSKTEGGELFLEDFVTHHLQVKNQRVWARQLNIENEGTHLLNDSSDVWVLGYKTERGGVLLQTQNRGRSEILGGFSYTTTAGKLAPMFVTEDSAIFAFFGEVCFNGDPFATLIRESRAGIKKEIKRGEGSTTPYIAHPATR